MVKYLEVQLNINQMLEGNINQHNRVRLKSSQELRMLSSVTINCQVTKIVINPGSQLSVL